MQANFSVAYDCYSLKTISDFIIKHIKMLRQANCTCDKRPLPRLLTGALTYSIYSTSQADICFYITPLK